MFDIFRRFFICMVMPLQDIMEMVPVSRGGLEYGWEAQMYKCSGHHFFKGIKNYYFYLKNFDHE